MSAPPAPPKTCVDCGAPDGQSGAIDRNGRWHEDSMIHAMNSDVGGYLFNWEFPDTKTAKIVTTKDGTLLCRACLLKRVRPTMPKRTPKPRPPKGGQLELPL
jgi:hypothetical protein